MDDKNVATVAIPKRLYLKIRRIVEKDINYPEPGDFVRDAVEKKIRDYEKPQEPDLTDRVKALEDKIEKLTKKI
ncbi:MAG: hypothetical protein KKD39_03580 [Candidatus Altiarchaeota archaeon]|nr:hypothetical protein [Candidatus Altiarchaeota archaeon]